MEASELECCLTVENLNSNGVVMKRRTFKSITVVLGRDEFRDIALRIVSSQSPLGETFLLEELIIHKRFLQEGKATIKLLTQMIQIMFSNCPSNQLVTVFKCLSLKLAQRKQNWIASNRRRLLSDKAGSFENINPLTDKDFTVGCKKRPLEDKNGVTPKRIKTTGPLVLIHFDITPFLSSRGLFLRMMLYQRRSSRVRVHGNFGQRENYETREYCESPREDDI